MATNIQGYNMSTLFSVLTSLITMRKNERSPFKPSSEYNASCIEVGPDLLGNPALGQQSPGLVGHRVKETRLCKGGFWEMQHNK